VVSNKVEAAYKRTSFFDRRRTLMEKWASFCMATKPIKQPSLAVEMEEECA
jgi:hypothetical protein